MKRKKAYEQFIKTNYPDANKDTFVPKINNQDRGERKTRR